MLGITGIDMQQVLRMCLLFSNVCNVYGAFIRYTKTWSYFLKNVFFLSFMNNLFGIAHIQCRIYKIFCQSHKLYQIIPHYIKITFIEPHVHSCTHWMAEALQLPPPAFGLIYEGAIGQPR
jgi:hypothetical protein